MAWLVKLFSDIQPRHPYPMHACARPPALPQFTNTAGWPLPIQLAVLGVLYALIAGTVYLPLGYAADRVLGARPVIVSC
jgi:hypothetical protein